MARILYVEDNDDNVYMLKNRLERAATPSSCRDGRAGVEVASEQPDLILMDLEPTRYRRLGGNPAD